MQILSVGPLRTGSLVWQKRAGGFVLTVVCKATYWLQPGEAMLSNEQEALNEADDHWDDDPNRSLRAASDLVPQKPRPEVTLVGYAYAPGQQPVRSLVARMVVGEVDKAIEVFCDRSFLPDGSLQEGTRFTRMRLTWERAGGGPGTHNPVGIRADVRDGYGRRTLPNLQPLGVYVSQPDDFVPPICFAPIAMSWPSRADLVGRAPPPAGVGLEGPSEAYFNAAPSDQLLSALRDNERIVLENLHPEHPRLITNLPGVRPAIFVDRGQGAAQRQKVRADALWIDTDRGIATLTWRVQIPLARPDEPGRVIVGMEMPGHELSWGEIVQAMAASESKGFSEEDHTQTNVISQVEADAARRAALPFSASPLHPGAREPQPSLSGDLPFQSSVLQPPTSAPRPWGQPLQTPPQPPTMKPPPVPAAARGSLPGTVVSPAPVPPVSKVSPSVSPPAPKPAPISTPAFVPPVVSAPVAAPPPVPAPVAVSTIPAAPPTRTPPVPPPVRPGTTSSEGGRGPSPWVGGAPGGVAPGRETLGTAAAAAAAAVAEAPKDSASDGGALGASNEAAGVRPWSAPRREIRSLVAEEEAQKPVIVRELLHLVWFEPSFVPRIRRVPSWKRLLSELEQRGADKEIDDVLAGKEAWEIEDRREIFEILARADRMDERGLVELMDQSIRDDGKYATPIVLVAGELETPFDEMETLKALSTAAAPLVGPTDEGLKAAVEAADKFVARSGLSWAPVVPEGLSNRIREAFAREKKGLPADALDTQAERALLGGRHYQKREVLGGTYLRLLLRLTAEATPIVAYAPEAVARKLPMFRKFRTRLVGELHPAQDQYEARGEALRALAIGTVTTPERGTAGAKS
ncbi:DUF2169 family type VI secretion system accessory protein [Polyangium spumosum]|nr:DUF2169 domain-containing protein [Polyangium spumosum]